MGAPNRRAGRLRIVNVRAVEEERSALQSRLDADKTQRERNELGQFATPPMLAREIVSVALSLLPKGEPIRFLDPAIGTGSFFAALLEVTDEHTIEAADGYEIDPHYGKPAAELWRDSGLKISLTDFTTAQPPARGFNLLVSNPPYVRHHHLTTADKFRLRAASRQAAGVELSGLAGLYCHFLALCHSWMSEDGVAAWLIPSEFMDVNYGRAVKQYLLSEVTMARVHRFDPNDVQFGDALVSSAVVFFKKRRPAGTHTVAFTWGGTISRPALSELYPITGLARQAKWTRLPRENIAAPHDVPTISDLFSVKRGLATGSNSFFILEKSRIEDLGLPLEFLKPILPSPRHVAEDEIQADAEGNPIITPALFLLDCRLPEEEVRAKYPALWRYLESGRETIGARYLCQSRALWYQQEDRKPAPFVCTYMGRSDANNGRPFRFLLNHSRAVAANTYLMLYPKPEVVPRLRDKAVLRRVWELLNAIQPTALTNEGRVYGGGLHKMEPRELANVPVREIAEILGVARPLSLF